MIRAPEGGAARKDSDTWVIQGNPWKLPNVLPTFGLDRHRRCYVEASLSLRRLTFTCDRLAPENEPFRV